MQLLESLFDCGHDNECIAEFEENQFPHGDGRKDIFKWRQALIIVYCVSLAFVLRVLLRFKDGDELLAEKEVD